MTGRGMAHEAVERSPPSPTTRGVDVGPKGSRPVVGLYRCVYIPFGENMVGDVSVPGWRSLSLADPGLTYVSPSGNFLRPTVNPERSRCLAEPSRCAWVPFGRYSGADADFGSDARGINGLLGRGGGVEYDNRWKVRLP